MPRKILAALVVILFFLLSLAQSHASQILSLSEIRGQNISGDIQYYRLTEGFPPGNLEEIPRWLNGLPTISAPNNFGDRYVGVFEIKNDTLQQEWYLYPYGSVVQNITIYAYSEDRNQVMKSGYLHHNPVLYHYGGNLSLKPGRDTKIVMLFDSDYFFAPIKIVMKPSEAAEDAFAAENVIFLMCMGIGLALGIYNLFLFIGSKDSSYFYYAMATLSYMWGWAHVFGLIEQFTHSDFSALLMPPYILGSIFTLFFAKRFLDLRQNSPGTNKFATISAWGSVALIPMALFNPGLGVLLASLSTGLALITGLYAGIFAWRKNYKPARFFVMAFLAVLIPNMIGNLMNLGILPGLNVNIYLLGLAGNTLEGLLLAFALADRIRLINRQNLELKDNLEEKVLQRTDAIAQANTAMEHLIGELQMANKAKSNFLANMSHEIRTPLTSIIGYAETVLNGEVDPSEEKRFVGIIAENGHHLLHVINDILDISKIEANKLEYEKIATPLFSILAQVESVMAKRARDKGIEFKLDYRYPLPSEIITDPTRLRQILFNLTNNAVKFTHKGYIKLKLVATEKTLSITVEDSGIGITKQKVTQLFTPFTQGQNSTSREFGGTGLGLSISKSLAVGLDGDIKVDSVPNKGSNFELQMPLTLGPNNKWISSVEEIWQITPMELSVEQQGVDFAGARILLADDHPNNRELIALLLKRMNIKVFEVEDGQQAIDAMFKQRFDLVLMDIQMPKVDGMEALRSIRRVDDSTPVIALTANNMKHEIELYRKLGFNDHIAKPVVRETFVATLKKYLASNQKQDSLLDNSEMLPIIRDYHADLSLQLDDCEKAFADHNWSGLGELSHRIKGSAGSFGFQELGDKFAELEHYCKAADPFSIEQYFPQVLEYARLCASIPGINIPLGVINYNCNMEQLLDALNRFSNTAEELAVALVESIENGETSGALLQLKNIQSKVQHLGFEKAIEACETLENLIKEGLKDLNKANSTAQVLLNSIIELKKKLDKNQTVES